MKSSVSMYSNFNIIDLLTKSNQYSKGICKYILKYNSNVEYLMSINNGKFLIQYLSAVGTELSKCLEKLVLRHLSVESLDISSLIDAVDIDFDKVSIHTNTDIVESLSSDFSFLPNFYLVFSRCEVYTLALSFLSKSNADNIKRFFRREIMHTHERIYRNLSYLKPYIDNKYKAEFNSDLSKASICYTIVKRYAKSKNFRVEYSSISPVVYGVKVKPYLNDLLRGIK